MAMIAQILFIIISASAIFLFTKQLLRIRRNIFIGKNNLLSDQKAKRWKNVFLLALGQKKMFKKPIVAFLHLIVYLGFIIINIELLEIMIDGILGTHRIFETYFEKWGFPFLYNVIITIFELLAALVIMACVFFLTRRNLLKLKRFISKDLEGWPRTDANYILIAEIILMSLFLLMNAADTKTHFIISSYLQPFFSGLSNNTLFFIEQSAWWLHILGIYVFMNYLPYSKHLHIILAFPNSYYAPLTPKGSMHNMPEVQKEVLYAMQPELAPTNAAAPSNFGAKDVMDLNSKNLLDAYSCTECGRCSAACPAHLTGKLLSPRKIMMATRDRLEEVGKNIEANSQFVPDNKTLLHNYITVEELRACTTCNACVEECPVSISPLDIILELRRSLIMEESNAPQEWNSMFSNIENNFAPWKFAPDQRDAWTHQA